MINIAIRFIKRVFQSPVGSYVSQLLQIGVLSTIWMFVGNMVKTMQRNIVNLTTTAVATVTADALSAAA